MEAEYIGRQAAIDALCSVCGVDCDKSEFVYDGKQEDQVILCPEHYALTQLPSAQPEIVRCKDCVHYDLAKNGYNGQCNRQYATFYANDFCSYGERRGDAE